MDQHQHQIPVEETSPEHLQPDRYFPPSSPLSQLSSTDALAELVKFRNSPFFAHYRASAQLECDKATAGVFKPLNPEDPYALQHREQLIGEAQAYLFLASKSDADLAHLQRTVTEQQNQTQS